MARVGCLPPPSEVYIPDYSTCWNQKDGVEDFCFLCFFQWCDFQIPMLLFWGAGHYWTGNCGFFSLQLMRVLDSHFLGGTSLEIWARALHSFILFGAGRVLFHQDAPWNWSSQIDLTNSTGNKNRLSHFLEQWRLWTSKTSCMFGCC